MAAKHHNYSIIVFSTAFIWLAFYFLWICYDRPLIGIDDANIYQVYMRNLAQGHGFVYQIGGEKVEGFTSLLWVLIGAVYYKIFIHPEWALLITSVCMINCLLIILNIELNNLFDRRGLHYYHVFFCLCLLIISGYFDWTLLPQMETPLWSLLLCVTSLQAGRNPTGTSTQGQMNDLFFGGLLVLLILTRPESMLWAPILLVLRIIRFRLTAFAWSDAVRHNLPACILAGCTLAALMSWRLWYFGYPFPNTYYAKVSSSTIDNAREGLFYVVRFIRHNNPMLLVMYAWSLGWLWRIWRSNRLTAREMPLAILIIISLINPLLPLITGGDHFFLGRVLQPVFPLTFLTFTYLYFTDFQLPVRFFPAKSKRLLQSVLFVIVVLFLPNQFRCYEYPTASTPLMQEYKIAREGRQIGAQLNAFFENVQPKPVLGAFCAGGVAYAYAGPTLDLLGLNNIAMAHAQAVKPTDRPKNHGSFNREVFYTQRPDLMCPTLFLTDTVGLVVYDELPNYSNIFVGRALNHIHLDKQFKALYVPALVTKNQQPEVLYTYFLRTYIAQLDTSYFHIHYLAP